MTAAAVQVVGYDPLKDSRHREAVAARDLEDWLRHLDLGNKAPRTLDTYERVCAVLLRMFPQKAFHEFTEGDVAHTLASFPRDSRATNKAALNGWFKWGYQHRRIPGNPVDLLPTTGLFHTQQTLSDEFFHSFPPYSRRDSRELRADFRRVRDSVLERSRELQHLMPHQPRLEGQAT